MSNFYDNPIWFTATYIKPVPFPLSNSTSRGVCMFKKKSIKTNLIFLRYELSLFFGHTNGYDNIVLFIGFSHSLLIHVIIKILNHETLYKNLSIYFPHLRVIVLSLFNYPIFVIHTKNIVTHTISSTLRILYATIFNKLLASFLRMCYFKNNLQFKWDFIPKMWFIGVFISEQFWAYKNILVL